MGQCGDASVSAVLKEAHHRHAGGGESGGEDRHMKVLENMNICLFLKYDKISFSKDVIS